MKANSDSSHRQFKNTNLNAKLHSSQINFSPFRIDDRRTTIKNAMNVTLGVVPQCLLNMNNYSIFIGDLANILLHRLIRKTRSKVDLFVRCGGLCGIERKKIVWYTICWSLFNTTVVDCVG